MEAGTVRQLDVYFKGAAGVKPELPMAIEELEALARETLPIEAYDYVAGSAGSESSCRANLSAFDRWKIVPRMWRDVSQRDHSIQLFGMHLASPLLLAPIGVQGIAHAEGELAAARAASSLGVPFCASTVSSFTLEEIAEACGGGPRYFQLYWPQSHELKKSLVGRAEKSGYSAIVVTLDTGVLGWRERDLKHAYLPFLKGLGLANYFSDPVFRAALKEPPEQNPRAAIEYWGSIYPGTSRTWDDLSLLKHTTSLPVLVKGIMHPDDAQIALKHGVDGIIVSNHGGRQVDGGLAALEALPNIVDRVKGRVPVLFDSGIRRGVDLVKALAMGASAVLLGRPYMWGLAAAGESGVKHVIANLLADYDITMAMAGYSKPSELSVESLRYEGR